MIRLSIIIPHYNSADLLKKLLSTIPNVPEVQVIVVDDFSTQGLDELEECKQRYVNTNVEFYTNEGKKSAGGARNTGLKYAKGQWLLFADADDYFLPGFYEIVERYYDSTYDMVFFVPTSIDLSTNQIADRHLGAKFLIDNYLKHPSKRNCVRMKYMIPTPWSILIRGSVVKNNGIKFDEIIVANDVMGIAKIAVGADSVSASDKVIYCVTKQAGTLTTVVSEERFDIRTDVFFRRFHYLKDNLPKDEYKMIYFYARNKLKQIKQYGFGGKKYLDVLIEMLKHRVPIWREFSPLYYYDVCSDLLNKRRKQNEKI